MKLLQTEAFVFHNEKIFASSMRRNGLYIHDVKTGHSECTGIFEGSELYEWRLHRTAVLKDDDVFFLPDRAKGIHRLNTITNHIDYFPLDLDEDARFSNGLIVGNTVYCIQNRPTPGIITFDIDSLEQSSLAMPNLPEDFSFADDYHFEDDMLYLVDKANCLLVSVDCISGVVKSEYIIEKNGDMAGFGTVCKVKDEFVFSTQNGIVIWNVVSQKSRLITDYPDGYGMLIRDGDNNVAEIKGFKDVNGNNEQPFLYSFCRDEIVVLLANRTNMSLALEPSSGELTSIELPDEEETVESLNDEERVTHAHYICNLAGQNLPFFSTRSRRIYIGNCHGDYNGITINDSELQWFLIRGVKMFWENEYYGLDRFAGDLGEI